MENQEFRHDIEEVVNLYEANNRLCLRVTAEIG